MGRHKLPREKSRGSNGPQGTLTPRHVDTDRKLGQDEGSMRGLTVCVCLCVCVCVCVSHSVVSDSLRPHELQPARLLCPWDSPGQSTGLDCHPSSTEV